MTQQGWRTPSGKSEHSSSQKSPVARLVIRSALKRFACWDYGISVPTGVRNCASPITRGFKSIYCYANSCSKSKQAKLEGGLVRDLIHVPFRVMRWRGVPTSRDKPNGTLMLTIRIYLLTYLLTRLLTILTILTQYITPLDAFMHTNFTIILLLVVNC